MKPLSFNPDNLEVGRVVLSGEKDHPFIHGSYPQTSHLIYTDDNKPKVATQQLIVNLPPSFFLLHMAAASYNRFDLNYLSVD